MEIIDKGSKQYPKQLLQLKQPPEKLYVEGNIELLTKNCIAIVGSRRATSYGKKYAAKFAKELAQKGICVVSGLAKRN